MTILQKNIQDRKGYGFQKFICNLPDVDDQHIQKMLFNVMPMGLSRYIEI